LKKKLLEFSTTVGAGTFTINHSECVGMCVYGFRRQCVLAFALQMIRS